MSAAPDAPAQMYMGSGQSRRRGTVTRFDRAAGTGTITADDGTVYPFHCIEIADGSRVIDAGTPVEFGVLARFGSYQAAQIQPV